MAPSKKRKTATAAAAATPVASGLWQWWSVDAGKWEDYPDVDASVIENAYVKATSSSDYTPFQTSDLSSNEGGRDLMLFDFKVMTQVNWISETSRKIRRAAAIGYTSDADGRYVAALNATSNCSSSPTDLTLESAIAATFNFGADDKLEDPGAQSTRGMTEKELDEVALYGSVVSKSKHAKKCFEKMLQNEKDLAGDYVCFYHYYSSVALLYEVQAALASLFFHFRSEKAALPRLFGAPYHDIPDAKNLLAGTPLDDKAATVSAGLTCTTSLVDDNVEASLQRLFLMGHSTSLPSDALAKLLQNCGVPIDKVDKVVKEIVETATAYGLDTSGLPGGIACKSGRTGHILQIFLRRQLGDRYAYPSLPDGSRDAAREPLSRSLSEATPLHGQAVVVFNPDVFMRANLARLFTFCADPTIHDKRHRLQARLEAILQPVIAPDFDSGVAAAMSIFGGKPAKHTIYHAACCVDYSKKLRVIRESE